MKTGVVVMARMGSQRLPGKVLLKLGNKPTLQHVVERCRRAKGVDDVIVVCTDDEKDIAIVDFCKEKKYHYFIGEGLDVIQQVLDAAKKYNIEIIIDITADCPLVDPKHISILLKNFYKKNILYASNLLPRTFPDGFDIQIYHTGLLKIVNSAIPRNDEKRRNCGWNIAKMITMRDTWTLITKNPLSDPLMRLTLDTYTDWEILNNIFRYFGHNKFGFKNVLKYISKK